MAHFVGNVNNQHPEWENEASNWNKAASGSEGSVVARFFERVQSVFQKPHHEHRNLKEHSIQVRLKIEQVADDLQAVKDEMEEKLDAALFEQIRTVLDPMLREVNPLKKREDLLDGTGASKAASWIEKAMLWVSLYSKLTEKDALEDTVVKHVQIESEQIIEGDITILANYLEQSLTYLDMPEQERKVLQEEMEKEVEPHLLALREIPQPPENFSIDKVGKWTEEIGSLRQLHFNLALQLIDHAVEELPSNDPMRNASELKQEVNTLSDALENESLEGKRKILLQNRLRQIESHVDNLAIFPGDLKQRINEIRLLIDQFRHDAF